MSRREHVIKQSSPLPTGYRRLEYIQATGSQYIDLGIIPENTITLHIRYLIDYANTTWSGLIFSGDYYNSSNAFGLSTYNSNRHEMRGYRAGVANIWPDAIMGTAIPRNTELDIFLNSSSLTVEFVSTGMIYTKIFSQNQITSSSRTLFLFKGNSNTNDLRNNAVGKVKFLEIGNMLYVYVPALRELDSKPGLYDLVNNQFLTNAGSSEFLYA